MINKFRRLLIRIGKTLPFIICFLACLNYLEIMFALSTCDYLDWNGAVIPNTRISFFIGQYFDYNIQMVVVLWVLSVATSTCIYNKLACLYLTCNLVEKSYYNTVELYPEQVAVIITINLLVCAWLCWKGVQMLK
jgi:hypothetical protein